MSIDVVPLAADRSGALARFGDFVQLTKPRIAVLELVTVGVGFHLASAGRTSLAMLHVMCGTLLVAASASALNQVLEVKTDRMMRRTATRPLPSGRIQLWEAKLFAAATLALGLLQLALCVNLCTALLGLLSWQLYVWVYTPMKRLSLWNTWVGAAPGALPIVMGWTGATGAVDWGAASLFLVMFVWQFPHFMAICWLCRDEYRRAGIEMISGHDPSGRLTGWTAVLTSMVLVLSVWLPWCLGLAGGWYFLSATGLSFGLLYFSWRFLHDVSQHSARLLLRASLLYLPLLFAALLLDAAF